MKKAQYADQALVVEILTDSFENNQSVNYIVRQDRHRTKRIRALMEYSFTLCMQFGQIWLTEDEKACALVLYPDKKKTTLHSICLDIMLIMQAIGLAGIKKTLDREASIKAKQRKGPVAYLWFIGVTPLYQHRGIGTRLMREIISDEREQSRTIILETSTLENLRWYERLGFKVYDTLEMGYRLHFLSNQSA